MSEFAPLLSPAADWLDVTYHPADVPLEELKKLLIAYDFVPHPLTAEGLECYQHIDQTTLTPSKGMLQISCKQKAYRISASGGVLATLRRLGGFNQYLTVLASSPYRVTRLDAALDVNAYAPSVIAALDLKYPQQVTLARQRPLKTSVYLSRRPDGARSGTWYAGQRTQARVTARVYDKTYELLLKSGLSIPDEYVRYEFTFKKGMANLNDAYDPASIFYAHSSAVVTPPHDTPAWTQSDVPSWVSDPVNVLYHEAMLRRVQSSLDLRVMQEIADHMGPEGRPTLIHGLCKMLDIDSTGIRFKRNKAHKA